MSKSSKNKKTKVPKITEEEYMAYLSALRAGPETGAAQALAAQATHVIPPADKK